jgi:hypothetical protein
VITTWRSLSIRTPRRSGSIEPSRDLTKAITKARWKITPLLWNSICGKQNFARCKELGGRINSAAEELFQEKKGGKASEKEDESWKENGGANVWSTITADLERGLVFLPVSSAGPDPYGGDRKGANLFSDSVVALDAKTGKYVWHFQTVHHDLWDYDLAAPPILVRVKHDSREVDAVAQATKT